MSWSFNTKGKKWEATKAVITDKTLPGEIRQYILDGIMPFGPDEIVTVAAHGHVYDGTNYAVTSASINVFATPDVLG